MIEHMTGSLIATLAREKEHIIANVFTNTRKVTELCTAHECPCDLYTDTIPPTTDIGMDDERVFSVAGGCVIM